MLKDFRWNNNAVLISIEKQIVKLTILCTICLIRESKSLRPSKKILQIV